MYKQRFDRDDDATRSYTSAPYERRSLAERELTAFVTSVTNLLGPEQTKFLTDIWLDELASMERMPAPTSVEWRLVTIAASARLASRLAGL